MLWPSWLHCKTSGIQEEIHTHTKIFWINDEEAVDLPWEDKLSSSVFTCPQTCLLLWKHVFSIQWWDILLVPLMPQEGCVRSFLISYFHQVYSIIMTLNLCEAPMGVSVVSELPRYPPTSVSPLEQPIKCTRCFVWGLISGQFLNSRGCFFQPFRGLW